MYPSRFDYHRAASVEEAARLSGASKARSWCPEATA